MKISKACTMAGFLGAMLSSGLVFASGGGGETFLDGVNYLPIKPPIVVNYGNSPKAKYVKAEISLRVEGAHSAQEVSHHMPLIRDTLILLLSSATDEQLGSGEGKDELRSEALEKINEAIEEQVAAGMPKRKKSTRAKDHEDNKDHEAEDEHEHGKKDTKERPKRTAKKAVVHGPVSDLLFDNLVVQK